MPTFEIIHARPWHCGQMVHSLRAGHSHILTELDVNSHAELRARFFQSHFRRAWLIDGKLAALGGVTGTPLSPVGAIWLAVTDVATKYPVAMVKEARRQIGIILDSRHRVNTLILSGDEPARRFALSLGFEALGPCGDHVLMGIERREAA